MKSYNVIITETFFTSLQEIISYKAEYDENLAYIFQNTALNFLSSLEYLPNRWSNLFENYKTLIFEKYIIIYKVEEKKNFVYIMDIIDPKQYTKFNQYL